GNPIIYQGEELGLPQGEVAFEDLLDPEAIANWPHTLGRDGTRTPMPWSADARHAGFSTADRTWLKLDPAHAGLAIDSQAADPASTLSFTRQLLAVRREHAALVRGGITVLDSPQDVLAFLRHDGERRVLCVFNLGESTSFWNAPPHVGMLGLIATESAVGSGYLPGALDPGTGYWASASGG
ncbi:MAG: DUF3459 domain-containing protein, partial [Erythrobacter sp.]